MADNVEITAGSGTTVATDQVTGTLEHVQLQKLAYSADGSRTLVTADADGLLVNLGTNNDVTVTSIAAGTNNIGDVDVLTVPSDPFGANADAASASGSISAKLRFIASTGIPITGTVTVGSHAVTNAGTFAVQNTPVVASLASTMNASSSDGATALTSTAQVIKGSAGALLGYYIYNPNSSAQFVQFYNTAAASVTVGTTNPLFMLTIPAASAANLTFPYPVTFGTAMSWSATSTAGGNGAPTTALDAVCWYA